MRRLKRFAAALATAAVATVGAVESGVLKVPDWVRQALTGVAIASTAVAPSALPRPKGKRAPPNGAASPPE